MLRRNCEKQTQMELVTYDLLVPEAHLLRKINAAIDFSFIYELCAPLYCEDNGRPAVDPEVLFRMLFVGYLYGIRSEVQLVQEIQCNMAYRWFCGLSMTEKVPDHATISINRQRRFKGNQIAEQIFNESLVRLERGKIVGLVGGDHSTPYGLIRAVAEKEERIGVLQIDAHADLREAYEGFQHSHASIMHNVLADISGVESLVQVAVRDLSEEEARRIEADPRITAFYDRTLANNRFEGMTWNEQCRRIVEKLPAKVYVSFDIDGLTPENCPHTGTPVPGGVTFNEAAYLLAAIPASGRKIVGFDLCEVVPAPADDWDANVGARVLYKLCNQTLIE